jgi:hypothetical protein
LNDEIGFTLDLDGAAFRKVELYLVDWNLPDKNGKTIEIKDSEPMKRTSLRALLPDVFGQIEKAIDGYVIEQQAKKKAQTGQPGPSAPSAS